MQQSWHTVWRNARDSELRDDDVLVQIHAAGVNLLDSKIRGGEFKLILRYRLPFILGNDVAGVVVRVGSRVRRFEPGDEVYARPHQDRIGAFAEFISMNEEDAAVLHHTRNEDGSGYLCCRGYWRHHGPSPGVTLLLSRSVCAPLPSRSGEKSSGIRDSEGRSESLRSGLPGHAGTRRHRRYSIIRGPRSFGHLERPCQGRAGGLASGDGATEVWICRKRSRKLPPTGLPHTRSTSIRMNR